MQEILSPTPPPRRMDRGREAGFALVIVIWGVGLIALLALTVIAVTGYRVKAAANVWGSASAEALAEAAVNIVLLDFAPSLAAGQPKSVRFPADRRPVFCVLPGHAVAAVTVEDEAGKVDLNAAQPQLLRNLLAGAGLDEAHAAAVAGAIVSFRASPRDAGAAAAETAAYAAAGLPGGPKWEPFRTPFELGQVLGVTPDLLRRLLPFVTVYSYREIPDLALSPAGLAAAIGHDAQFVSQSQGLSFLVRAEVGLPGGAYFDREAIVEFAGGGRRPYILLEWRRGERRMAALPALAAQQRDAGAAPLPAC